MGYTFVCTQSIKAVEAILASDAHGSEHRFLMLLQRHIQRQTFHHCSKQLAFVSDPIAAATEAHTSTRKAHSDEFFTTAYTKAESRHSRRIRVSAETEHKDI
jgi:hypothetical protein